MNKDMFVLNASDDIPAQLTLDQIIEIAFERNFDLLVKEKEFEASMQKAMREELKMMPSLIGTMEFSHRNNDLIVSSKSVDPTIPPAPPSISTQKKVRRADANLILNLLDFGLAYYAGRKECHQAIQKRLEYRRVANQLVLDIIKQYWIAVVAKTALEEGESILAFAEEYQRKIDAQIAEQVISRSAGLKNEADLINIQIQVRNFAKEYHTAISDLALKMGLPPSTTFDLIVEPRADVYLEFDNICALETTALQLRPELYYGDLQEKIAEDEVRYAFLQMLPGFELFEGTYWDANKYFTFHHWLIAGARATWNLFSLPSHFYDGRSAMTNKEVAKLQRLALSVGVLSQVRLAHLVYQDNREEMRLANSLEQVSQKLLLAVEDEYKGGAASGADLLAVQTKNLFAHINAIKAYGALQVSLEEINNSIGLPRYYQDKMWDDICD